jgi:hypothetical protein
VTLTMVDSYYEGSERVLSDVTRSTLNVSAERPRPAVRSVMTNRPFKPPGPAMLWCAEDRAEDDEMNGFDDWGDLCNDTTAGLYNAVDGSEGFPQLDWEATKAVTADSPSYSPPCPSPRTEPQDKKSSEEEIRLAHNPFARRKGPPDNEMVIEVLGASSQKQNHSSTHPINTSAMLQQVLRPRNGAVGGLGAARRVINHRASRVVPIFQPPRLESVHSTEQDLKKPSDWKKTPATKQVHHDHVKHQGLPSHDTSSLVIDLSSIDEKPGHCKPICAIFDVQPEHNTIREESAMVGEAPDEIGDFIDEAWWLRLPDFVPVTVLQARGCNPRDGSTVYIQYTDQFSGSKRVSQIKGAPKSPKSSNKNMKKASTASTNCEQHSSQLKHCQTQCGHWITINGRKVYVNAAGKHLSGRQAYTAARKEKDGKLSKGSNPKRGRRK